MKRALHIRVRSQLSASADEVWRHASSFAGVNSELSPVHMRAPKDAELGPDVPLGRPLLLSLVTLKGWFPLDLHELTLVEVEPGSYFHERSRSLLERRWEHRRRVTADSAGGCSVEDDVTFEPRLLPWLVLRVVERIFARRHAHLRRRFGSSDSPTAVCVERVHEADPDATAPRK